MKRCWTEVLGTRMIIGSSYTGMVRMEDDSDIA
jgi:hypothetical protein